MGLPVPWSQAGQGGLTGGPGARLAAAKTGFWPEMSVTSVGWGLVRVCCPKSVRQDPALLQVQGRPVIRTQSGLGPPWARNFTVVIECQLGGAPPRLRNPVTVPLLCIGLLLRQVGRRRALLPLRRIGLRVVPPHDREEGRQP